MAGGLFYMAVRTSGEISGLAVMTLTGGERLGRVKDIVFNPGSGRVTGFLVDGGGLFAHAKFLGAGLVKSVGADALTIAGADALGGENPAPSDPDELEAHALEGRAVMSESGAALGKVTAVLINTDTLTVPGFVVATGLIDNTLHGRPTLPLSQVRTIGPDSIVVPDTYDPKAPEYHAPTS